MCQHEVAYACMDGLSKPNNILEQYIIMDAPNGTLWNHDPVRKKTLLNIF